GNRNIDDFIKSTHLKLRADTRHVLEWIPFEEFGNIEKIGNGGFSQIFRATWNKGIITSVNAIGTARRSSMEVILKVLDKSQDIDVEFLKELDLTYKFMNSRTIYYLISVYGVTQDSESKNYAFVLQYIRDEAEKDRKQLIALNKLLTKDLGIEHPNSKYHSRLLNPMLDSLGLSVNSTHLFKSGQISEFSSRSSFDILNINSVNSGIKSRAENIRCKLEVIENKDHDKIKQECEEHIDVDRKNDRNTESTQLLFQTSTVMSPGACNFENNMDECNWNNQQWDQFIPFDSETCTFMSLGAGTYNHVVEDIHPWNYNHAQLWNYNHTVNNAQPWNEYTYVQPDFREQINTSQRVYDHETKSHILNTQQWGQHTQSNCEEYTTTVRNAHDYIAEGTQPWNQDAKKNTMS
ncbi:7766_t:CDS:2, partial [Acaulospora morrowiae]